jgi:hypothetical protein
MRALLAALFLCLACSAQVAAKPSRLTLNEFRGDPWLISQAGTTASDVGHIMRCPPPHCARVRVKQKWKRERAGKLRLSRRWHPSRGAAEPLPKMDLKTRREGAQASAAKSAASTENIESMDAEQEAAYRVIAALLAGGKVYVRPAALPATSPPPARQTLLGGLAREIRRALPRGRSLAGVVAPLAAKANELVDRCGSRVISGMRQTYVAGTRRISLHASGRAVDMAGNPSCMYALLRKWPGGVSIDYPRVKHIHISYAPPARGQRGREWGVRFAHHHVGRRTRYARHHQHKRHYASAR